MADIKHFLRKVEFPGVVLEALHHIQKLWMYDANAQQLMKEIAEEFVFFEVDHRRIRRQKLPPVKELQVLDRICYYFSTHGNDQKTMTFMYLFPPGTNLIENRLKLLCKLVSVAVGLSSGSVLTFVGMWMQLNGCMSETTLHVAKTVVEDYFEIPSPKGFLRDLPCVSPLFCASFITSLTALYSLSLPSCHIAETILDWLNTSPTVSFAPLKASLPFFPSFHGPQTPLPGILFWCVLEPFFNVYRDRSGSELNGETQKKTMFSSLHLSLLQCMMNIIHIKDFPRFEIFTAKQISFIIDRLKQYVHIQTDAMDTALNRFSQALQVALATNCIHSHIGNLKIICEKYAELPYNRLLHMIIKRWMSPTLIV